MELFCASAATPTGLSIPAPSRLRPRHPPASLLQVSFRTRRNPLHSFPNPDTSNCCSKIDGGNNTIYVNYLLSFQGARCSDSRLLTAATSEDAASGSSISTKEGGVPVVDAAGSKQYAWQEDAPSQTRAAGTGENYGTPVREKEDAFKEEGKSSDGTSSVIEYEEIARESHQNEALQFLSNMDLKLDSEDAYSVLLYGSGAFLALWVSSAIIGALDSLPLIPKVLEIIGLGYTVWFSYRYLIFKKNRDELLEKFEDLKEQILGPSD